MAEAITSSISEAGQALVEIAAAQGVDVLGALTGDGSVPRWPNNRGCPPLITIDHVLADGRLGISDYGVEDLPGSDHRAIWARVFLPGAPRRTTTSRGGARRSTSAAAADR
jgi:endonuclease/exonuclease/phosphatase family metal-dependent hydrolase